MAYIGNPPITGNFQVCDAISVVNGQAAYTMQVSSANVSPESANHMLVSLNGILQKPGSSFTISGSTITFASNLATGDVIDFIMLLGNVLDIGTPSDATVTNAKTNFTSTSSAAGLQIKGDGTTDGTLQLNCSQNSHGIKLASPAHSAGQSYTLTFPTGNVTAGKILKVNSVTGSGRTGVGQLSFADEPSGSHSLLSTSTISSGTSAVTFDSSIITSTYKRYMVDFIDIYCSAGALLYWNVSDDNGSTYKTSSNYVYGVHGYESSSNGQNTSSTGNSRFVLTPQDHSTNALRPMALRMIVQPGRISSARNLYINYYTFGIAQDNEHAVAFNGAGYFASGEDKLFNNYKFFPSSGTFEGGIIKVYGIA